MDIKRFAGCCVVVLSAGTALAGPCDTTGRNTNSKDAGSGPASQSTSQTARPLPATARNTRQQAR